MIETLGRLAILLGVFITLFSVPMIAVLLLAMFAGESAVRLKLDQVDRGIGSGARFRPSG